MAGQANGLIPHLRKLVLLQDDVATPDGQLLKSFLVQHDEAAFAALVRRHGPMVLAVCRRILRNSHDAEDAFQATFLVLVRKANSIGRPELLGNWLYGAAYRTALAARGAAVKRKAKERDMAKPEAVERDDTRELAALLDRELVQLPEKYRVPIVLCDLEGKTRKETARQLGCPEGTIHGRLTRGRKMLARRLRRQGIVLPAGTMAALLAENAAYASVPASMAVATIKYASLLAAGQAAAAGLISPKVAALVDGMVKVMLLSKLKAIVALVLVAGFLVTGAAVVTYRSVAAPSATPAPSIALAPAAANAQTRAADERDAGNTIATLTNAAIDQVDDRTRTVCFGFGSKEKPTKLLNIPLAEKVRVVASYQFPGSANNLPFRWEYVKALQGKVVSVRFIANRLGVLVESISTANDAPPHSGKIKPAKILVWIEKLNAASRSVTASCMTAGAISSEMKPQRLENLSVSKSARITHKGSDIRFTDLKPGTGAILELDSSEGTFVGIGIEVIRKVPLGADREPQGLKAGDRKELAPGIAFRWCPAGKFKMGAGDDALDVELSKGFWLGETEVTQGQWRKLMGTSPWSGRTGVGARASTDTTPPKEAPDYAASYISHDAALSFCKKLTTQEHRAGRLPKGWKYSLPTEAQWEYACRAGTETKFSFGDDESQLNQYAWFFGDVDNANEPYAHQVGLKKPNAWGLCDTHGNVWEWCNDWYESKRSGGKDPVGPTTPAGPLVPLPDNDPVPPPPDGTSGKNRVVRGGSWVDVALTCTSANRFYYNPRLGNGVQGFRLAAVPSESDLPPAASEFPVGWGGGGSKDGYQIMVDKTVRHKGKASGSIKSIVTAPTWYGALTQAFKADKYRGQRLRMTAYVKSKDVETSAGLWMRVESFDGKGNYSLSSDMMGNRPIKGTNDWNQYEVVLDVPKEMAAQIYFGVLLAGKGQVWVDDFEFEAVSSAVKLTGRAGETGKTAGGPLKRLPTQPKNLDFEQ